MMAESMGIEFSFFSYSSWAGALNQVFATWLCVLDASIG